MRRTLDTRPVAALLLETTATIKPVARRVISRPINNSARVHWAVPIERPVKIADTASPAPGSAVSEATRLAGAILATIAATEAATARRAADRFAVAAPLDAAANRELAARVAAMDKSDPQVALMAALFDKLNQLALPRRIVRDSDGRPIGFEIVTDELDARREPDTSTLQTGEPDGDPHPTPPR